jgi:DNA polymerase III alpha subunit (gram-positive type)
MTNQKYLSFDIETTGLDHNTHEVIQIGAVYAEIVFDQNNFETPFSVKVLSKFDSLIKPQFMNNIDKEAMKINLISKSDLLEAPSLHQVRGDFIEWWEEVIGAEKLIPLGQNYGGFDKAFLQKFFQRFYDVIFDYHSCDTWTEARLAQTLGLIPGNIKLNLESLCDYFDSIRLSHSALSDALSALDVHCSILNLLARRQ